MSNPTSRNYLYRNPALYPDHGFLHHEIANRIVDYLDEDFVPTTILNDGAFDHYLTERLQERFSEALISENISSNKAQTYDLIVSNLYLQDVWEFEAAIERYQETLNGSGRLLFTIIGAGSFPNLNFADGIAINGFPDIEDVGNFIHGLGFKDPLLYIEKINLTYERLETLLNDARVVAGRPFEPFKGLRTKAWLERWKDKAKACFDGKHFVVSFDVIYAEARLPEVKNLRGGNNEVYVDISNLHSTKTP